MADPERSRGVSFFVNKGLGALETGTEIVMGPYSRFIQKHYEEVRAKAASTSDIELARAILWYKKLEPRSTVVIAGLGLADFWGLLEVIGRYDLLPTFAVALSAGPAAMAISAMSATRGIVRGEERMIFEEEQKGRVVAEVETRLGCSNEVAEFLGGGEYDAFRSAGGEPDSVGVGISAFFLDTAIRLSRKNAHPALWNRDDVLKAMGEHLQEATHALEMAQEEFAPDSEVMKIARGVLRGRTIANEAVVNGGPVSHDLLDLGREWQGKDSRVLQRIGAWIEDKGKTY